MQNKRLQPEVIVFAGPNGSGKTTITKMAKTVGVYINADDIKATSLCSDLEAAVRAEELREKAIEEKADFTFETVMSTDRNLNLLKKARENGFFIWQNVGGQHEANKCNWKKRKMGHREGIYE